LLGVIVTFFNLGVNRGEGNTFWHMFKTANYMSCVAIFISLTFLFPLSLSKMLEFTCNLLNIAAALYGAEWTCQTCVNKYN
jgi:hypothetical protein